MPRPILRVSCCAFLLTAALACGAQTINLPSSKQILRPVPGSPERLNSFPMAAAWSPDHRYLALVNAGFGTVESDYEQSIAVLDASTGKLTDFPEVRTDHRAHQTYYSGIAFSGDGTHLYVSFDSLSDPEGKKEGDVGNAIGVYRFSDGAITAERTFPVPLRDLAAGKLQHHGPMDLKEDQAIPAPAGLAVVKGADGGEKLLVADEYSDDALLLDADTGKLETRFDLSSGPIIPSTYPMAVTASADGRRAWVSLWNGSAVAELDLRAGKVVERLPLLPPVRYYDPSSHPIAMTLSPDGKTLYVALANRDQIAAVAVGGPTMRITALYPTRLPGQAYFGAIPDAVALSEDGATLYAANSGSDAVAVINLRAKPGSGAYQVPIGFIPTEWYPTALAVSGDHLYVATAKGEGTGPNAAPQPEPAHPTPAEEKELHRSHTYIATLLHGSLATIDLADTRGHLKELTEEVLRSNLMYAAQKRIEFQGGGNPIHHVIYIIKENRTYDQILGDLGVGDGDPSLTMYGKDITPNLHALALQFGVLDNFYDSGEVSGDGHVWSNAAIT
ncbi:MAG: YncE family protein, partial [Acidobacteriaceae bacterium]